MCGIAGAEKQETVEQLVHHMEHRGQSCHTQKAGGLSVGHVLHSVVGTVEQPLEGEGLLSANCEIYNWKEINNAYGWETENDAETLLKLLDREGVEGLEQIDGIYGFAYIRNGELVLARDRLGVNPVWYSEEPFAFASEKQALEKEEYEAQELHPRQILKYDIEEKEIRFENRPFFELNEQEKELEKASEEIKNLILEAVEKRVPEGEVGLLFSGGLDSTVVAAALQELGKDFTAYTAGIQHGNVSAPRDFEKAQETAEKMDFPLESYEASLEDVEDALPDLVDWISSSNVVKIGVALPFHFSLKQSGDEQVVFTGFGSEQLYAGYARQQGYLNKECLSDLRGIFHEDLYRDNVVAFRHGRELRVPFLDEDLVEHALSIPDDLKRNEEYRKYVLRKAAEKLGVPEDVVWRKKVAAQYGSNFDKALNRLTKKNGYSQKQAFLNSYREKENKKLVALTSGGKDSNAALFRMWRRNNDLSCLLTLRSENEASYMFDSKKTDKDLEWQAEQLDIPLIKQRTEGEKEKELEDLREGLKKAKSRYGVEGVVAGAIESSYQRDRVDRVADEVGLKVFTPLWQFNQDQYMKWLVRNGFEVEITEVAARGLSDDWKSRVLDGDAVEELLDLAEEYRFHPAGEGGEYETRVVGFPCELLDN